MSGYWYYELIGDILVLHTCAFGDESSHGGWIADLIVSSMNHKPAGQSQTSMG